MRVEPGKRGKMQKGLLIGLAAVALLSLLVAGCTRGPQRVATANLQVTIKYAKGFSIEYLSGGLKKITDGEGRELLLIPRGKEAPEQYKGLPKIKIPVEKVVVLSSTEAALLRPLGVLHTIVGTSQEQGWYMPEVKTGLEGGRIKFLGRNNALDYETLLSLHPDVVFLYTKSGRMDQVLAKLDELGIPAAVDNEWLEDDPLGRLEWVKFLAEFYNKEAAADQFFADAERTVQQVVAKTAGAQKPKVLWFSISRGMAYVPRGESYVAKLIQFAGGEYIFKEVPGTGSEAISVEEVLAQGRGADLAIYSSIPQYAPSIKAVLKANPVLEDLSVMTEGKAWQFQPWYWESLDKTAEQVQDVAAILHPELFPGYELKHMVKMAKE